MIKQYFPAIIFSTLFVLLLFFLNTRNSLNFVEEQKSIPTLTAVVPTKAVPTEVQWQTYRNEKYGFEFQYPGNWLVTNDTNIITFHDPNSQFNTVNIDFNSRVTMPLAKWIKSEDLSNEYCTDDNCSDGLPKYNGIKNIGNTSVETYTFYDDVSDSINYVLSQNKKFYEISIRSNKQDKQIINIYNQILSTFKFLGESKKLLGIQTNICCSCPTVIDASQIGENGWVKYQQGKNYSNQLPEICSSPNIGMCAPCPPVEADTL